MLLYTVLRYLKGSPRQGLLLPINKDLQLQPECDSDWASFPITCCQLTRYFICIGHSSISRKTKKQHTVSQSCAEAKYCLMKVTCREFRWLRYLLHDLQIPQLSPTPLYCDNQATLCISSNLIFHERTSI